MKTLYPNTPYSVLFQRGVILWRGIDADMQLQETVFEETPKKTYLCRCRLNGNWILEPEINDESGFVVFVDELPPKDWTHLIVKGISKQMYELGQRGGAIYASVAEPYNLESYLLFREEMREAVLRTMDSDFEVKHRAFEETWPDDFRVGDKRLTFSKGQYEHQEIPDVSVVQSRSLQYA